MENNSIRQPGEAKGQFFRLGIITFHRAYNCGAMLQAWALKTTLSRLGHSVTFPACNHVGERGASLPRKWICCGRPVVATARTILANFVVNLMAVGLPSLTANRFNNFRRRWLPEIDCRPNDFGNHFDLMIIGSDQVWSEKHLGDSAALFFAEDIQVPCVAYAVSYGDLPLPDDRLPRVVAAAKRCRAVSVREKLVSDQISARAGVEMPLVLDPTLLLSSHDYDTFGWRPEAKAEFLFVYALEASPFVVDAAQVLAKRLGVKLLITCVYQSSRYKAPKHCLYGVSPERMVGYIKEAKYVVAASFHGTALSVIYNKKFITIRDQQDVVESRPASLLRQIGCLERLMNPSSSLDEMENVLRTPIQGEVSKRLTALRIKSIEWLKGSLC